jgi:hypothetical protein
MLCVLAACSAGERDGDATKPLASDPMVARALHDPLMSDPDLSALNEANAVLGFAGDNALPVLPATPEAAQAAREAGRLELIEGGEIAPLPSPVTGIGPMPGRGASATELLAAIGAPQSCASVLEQGYVWAAALPEPAAIMPQGMVVRAGGADTTACKLRIIRYHTPAAGDDVLEYHFTRALRAGLRPLRYAEGGESLAARAVGGEAWVVAVRETASGLTEVDLLYRAP